LSTARASAGGRRGPNWPTWCSSATIAPAMLSRAQEVWGREILGIGPPGTLPVYCLEHLATTREPAQGDPRRPPGRGVGEQSGDRPDRRGANGPVDQPPRGQTGRSG